MAGEIIGIAPLYRVEEDGVWTMHLVGCTEVSDYLDIIIAAGREWEVYSDFLHYWEGPNAPDWDTINLCNLYEPSLSYRLLPELAQTAGWQAEVEQEDVAPYLPLADSFDAYLEGLDKKQRHEIRRKLRKLEREAASWRWYQVRDGEKVHEAMDQFVALHRLASNDKEDFMGEEMAAFFHKIAEMAARSGWLSLAFIEIDGRLAAAMFDFEYDGRIWLYNSGYDPDAYGHLSPGICLNALLIEDAINRGNTVFDFLQGNEVYKYRFGAIDAPVYRLSLRR